MLPPAGFVAMTARKRELLIRRIVQRPASGGLFFADPFKAELPVTRLSQHLLTLGHGQAEPVLMYIAAWQPGMTWMVAATASRLGKPPIIEITACLGEWGFLLEKIGPAPTARHMPRRRHHPGPGKLPNQTDWRSQESVLPDYWSLTRQRQTALPPRHIRPAIRHVPSPKPVKPRGRAV
jgi:hypothetical protein